MTRPPDMQTAGADVDRDQAPQHGAPADATILICDADDGLAELIAQKLSSVGYHVMTDTHADAALLRLQSRYADLILCDTELPETDGLAFLHQLRSERPDLADVPFIAMSVHSDRNDIIAGKLAGADDYVVKPVDMENLIVTVEAHLRQVARMRQRFAHAVPDMATNQQTVFGEVLDRLAFGVMLFTDTGAPIFCNRSAYRITGCDMTGIRDWLIHKAGLPEHPGWWASDRPWGPEHAVLVPNSDSGDKVQDWLFVTAFGLSQHGTDRRLTSVMIFAPELSGDVAAEAVARAVGLTPAETGVAGLLAKGLRLDDIATRLSVSKPTVSYHLRNIYQKTSTSRQADLIALLHCVQLTG